MHQLVYNTMGKIDLIEYHSNKRNGNPPRMNVVDYLKDRGLQ